MSHSLDRRRFLGAVLVSAAGAPAALAQERADSERKIDPQDLPLDKPGVWTLHFRYKSPRIVTLDGFDKKGNPAKQTVWYMWYQVYNKSGDPVFFIPEFELITRDLNTRHVDEPQPYIVKQLNAIENPTGLDKLKLLSTIEISKRPIPVTLPDSIPNVVTGVAVWTDMVEKAPRTNKFSVYVTGLSNGLATEQQKVPPGDEVITLIKRKTLKIDFLRPTDDNRPEITDIRPDEADGPAETWIYRRTGELKKREKPMDKDKK
jgi:hypothetical protein